MAADRTDIAHFFSSLDATGEVGSAAAGSKPLFHLRLVDRPFSSRQNKAIGTCSKWGAS